MTSFASLINQLATASPEEIVKYQDWLANLPKDQFDKLDLQVRSLNAGMNRTPQGFTDFFFCMTGNELAPYAREIWVPEFFAADEEHQGILLDCFRGATKSTFLMLMILFVTGHRPVGSSQLIRINDDAAAETDKAMAAIIEHSPAWQMCFTHVKPDDRAGWSTKGRFVIDDREDYGSWRQKCIADHLGEPTILCAGITSHDFIGKHPSNGQFFDDFHDERNTRSEREMQEVVSIIESDIVPTWTRPEGHPTLLVACTLWNERDGYHAMLRTGMFRHVKTPIYLDATNPTIYVNGNMRSPSWIDKYPKNYLDARSKWIIPVWDEAYPFDTIADLSKKPQFARMYECDLEKSAQRRYKYTLFPAGEIQRDWPMVVGVDPIGISKEVGGKGVSHYAMTYALKNKYGKVVIDDGFLKKCFMEDGERELVNIQRTRPSFECASIESDGAGAGFISMVSRNKGLKIRPHKAREVGVGSKYDRQFNFLYPLLSSGIVLVSDARSEYLDVLRRYLDRFPEVGEHDPEMDVADSLLLALLEIPEAWTAVVYPVEGIQYFKKKKKRESMWAFN